MHADELKAWLRLLLAPGLGRATARQLLQAFGTPEAVFQQTPQAWRELGLARWLPALLTEPVTLAAQVERTLDWLSHPNRCLITLGDAAYPPELLAIEDLPLLLFAVGALVDRWRAGQQPDQPRLAMVGSRNPTPQGEVNAREFARDLAAQGVCIVSGLALGIDGAAHTGALDAGGLTVAVVGTGLDRVYPGRHQSLAHRIAAQGAILSEFPLGTPPLHHHFPQRNRLIAGLSRATLVVEANLQSGSLITARLAAEQGKDVLAIPGSIHSPQSRGCHALIHQGARLVTSVQDVLEELAWNRAGPAPAEPVAAPTEAPKVPGPAAGHPLLDCLGFEPMGLDELQRRCGWPTERLQAELFSLELEGWVVRRPGGQLQRLVQA